MIITYLLGLAKRLWCDRTASSYRRRGGLSYASRSDLDGVRSAFLHTPTYDLNSRMTARFIPRWPAYLRLPDFAPVPMRGRGDGWTPVRQGDFIGFLAQTGSVAEAARQVGMSRESAYRLRRREGAQGFATAWDAALAAGESQHIPPFRKVTSADVAAQALGVLLQVRMRRGRYVGTLQKINDTMLLRHLAQLDRATAGRSWHDGAGG